MKDAQQRLRSMITTLMEEMTKQYSRAPVFKFDSLGHVDVGPSRPRVGREIKEKHENKKRWYEDAIKRKKR